MMKLPARLLLLALTVCLLMPAITSADLPDIRFDRLKPLGGAAGTEVDVEILGAEIDDVQTLLFDQPGLTATPIPEKPRFFRIQIAPEVPAGTYDVYLSGRWGVSNPRLFAVSHGIKNVLKAGRPHSPAEAQPVELEVAIEGSCDGQAADYYRFSARQGQRIVIDCQASRLDSELDADLTLTTATGQLLASNGDHYGQDPLIDFLVPADGEYIIGINDLSYRGGHPYRLVISTKPQIETIFPAAVQLGKPTELTAFGRNFGALGEESPWKIDELPLQQHKFLFTPDPEVHRLGNYQFLSHPTHHSVMPTAATCTLTGQQVAPPGLEAVWNPQPVLVTSHPVLIETEPNDDPKQMQPLTLPAVVAGRFQQPRDGDWYEFSVPENGSYDFNVYCERIAGRADPYLVIYDDQDNRITELDDFGHRMNAFDGHLRDPNSKVNLNKDRKYRAFVQDRYGRGGARYHYVLTIVPELPDFHIAAIHRSNPNPGGTTIFKGTATYLDIIVHQSGGYNGPISITAEGLPPGLHVPPTTLTNNSRGTVVLYADKDAADWTGFITLKATGERNGQPFERIVRPYSRIWNNQGTSCPQRSLPVAIREQGPFSLKLEPAEITVEAGQSAELQFQVERLWKDFQGPITVQQLSFPGGFNMGNVDIPADQQSAKVSIQVQNGLRPGKYTFSVMGQAQVPFNKKPEETNRPNTLVSTPSLPVTITVVPPEGK